MSTFAREDGRGQIKITSDRDVTLESDRDQDGAGDLVFKTGGVERARISAAGVGSGWPAVLGGSLPVITSSVTRDSQGRVSAFTNSAGSYTVTYNVSTGQVATISDGTTTRTISRDASGLVTGVA